MPIPLIRKIYCDPIKLIKQHQSEPLTAWNGQEQILPIGNPVKKISFCYSSISEAINAEVEFRFVFIGRNGYNFSWDWLDLNKFEYGDMNMETKYLHMYKIEFRPSPKSEFKPIEFKPILYTFEYVSI